MRSLDAHWTAWFPGARSGNSASYFLRPPARASRFLFWSWIVGALLCCRLFAATDTDRPPQAVIVGVIGEVEFRPATSDVWYPVATNHVLYAGDTLRTRENSRATLQLSDRSILPIRQSSTLQLLVRQENVAVRLLRGILSFFHRDEPGQIEIEGGGINASVRGTEFVFAVRDDQSVQITLYDGEIELSDPAHGSQLRLQSGEIATAEPGQPPRKTGSVLAGDWSAVQWALYYPVILDPAELRWTPPSDSGLQEAWERFRRGNPGAALAAYPKGRTPGSPAEHLLLAAILLSVGSVESAIEHLDAAARDPQLAPLATAHRRFISALTRGVHEGAIDESSATARLAASYLHQAAGELEKARDAARSAVSGSPDFGFAWVRLGEMEFTLGDIGAAQRSLDEGGRLVPEHAPGRVLRGFLLAARNQTSAAQSVFEEALKSDPASGNAWLGRGLSRIRQGDLEGGRTDLLIAAASEPQRAVLRSYLGKAMADSRVFRTPAIEDKARHELDLARRADPGDPTPDLYSALLNQRANRINEAIDDLESSIDLNDNRAIYRSRFGLDQDRAVRGANLAAIYQDAGLDTVSLRQATRAVEDNYSNFSSHQFLADSYNSLRDPDQVQLRYESAWFSEYLIANLLAPVGAGRLSTTVSPHEYSRMFERDGPGLAGRTDYWSNGDWQQTASQFGTFGNLGYAVDVFYRSTQGQRINDDSEQIAISAQAKAQLDWNDSLFLQATYYDAEFGDVASFYDPASANPDLRAKDRQEPQILAGWHHAWAPGSDTLFLVSRLDDRYTLDDPHLPQSVVFRNPDGSVFNSVNAETPLRYESDFEAWSFEAQHLWQQESHTVVGGVRYQTGEFETESDLGPARALGLTIPGLSQSTEADLGRFSAYAYEHWQILDWVRLTVGLSYDWLQKPVNYRVPPLTSGAEETDRLSPKAGVTMTPWKGGAIRAAYTRSLGGVSFDQSFRLEPSQVAGFTQTYRGLIPESIAGSVAGQEIEVVGVGIEQTLPTRTYLTLSLERLRSDADRKSGTREIMFGAPPTVAELSQTLEFEERNLLATAHQLVGRDLVLGVNYRLSDAELTDRLADSLSPREVDSLLHQLGLQVRFTHPSGFFALAETIWTHQSNHGYSPARPGDDFWHVNLFAGWRFLDRNLQITAGILNLTDQDYRLNPLNNYLEPYRDRTFTTSLRFDF